MAPQAVEKFESAPGMAPPPDGSDRRDARMRSAVFYPPLFRRVRADSLAHCALAHERLYRRALPGRGASLGAGRWALSSAVEHYLDMVGVRGSIPLAPTISGFEIFHLFWFAAGVATGLFVTGKPGGSQTPMTAAAELILPTALIPIDLAGNRTFRFMPTFRRSGYSSFPGRGHFGRPGPP